MSSVKIIRSLSALAQEHRLSAFRLLVQAGLVGVPAGRLADAIGVASSSMSFHLAQLVHAGLVRQSRKGRSIIYKADFKAMNGLMRYLSENCCLGEPCITDVLCSREGCSEKDVA